MIAYITSRKANSFAPAVGDRKAASKKLAAMFGFIDPLPLQYPQDVLDFISAYLRPHPLLFGYWTSQSEAVLNVITKTDYWLHNPDNRLREVTT